MEDRDGEGRITLRRI